MEAWPDVTCAELPYWEVNVANHVPTITLDVTAQPSAAAAKGSPANAASLTPYAHRCRGARTTPTTKTSSTTATADAPAS